MTTVLITGAGSGIGRSTARQLAADGWRVIAIDREPEALDRLRSAMAGEHRFECVDLTDPGQLASLRSIAEPIDALINNAGRSDASGMPLVDQPAARQAGLVALNLDAPASVVTALGTRLVHGARIVNVSSGAGLHALAHRGWYSPTKAGLIAQSKALALAHPEWIVTVLCPGYVRTELVEGLIQAGRLDVRRAVARTPMGRMADPAEMARMLQFLVSPDASLLRGQVVSLCGGTSVYAGAQGFEPATESPMPLDASTSIRIEGDAGGHWAGLVRSDGGDGYRALIDVSAWSDVFGRHRRSSAAGRSDRGGSERLLARVHEAARAFAAAHDRHASLTLLLPTASPADSSDWQSGGEAAAARMLVATLACELAPRALRVNALELDAGAEAEALGPLLEHVAGAGTQFLTGQTFRVASTG